MTSRSNPANPLGNFLRARRDELDPADVGLPTHGTRRRVPGLRREEIAQLAAISHDYYARLEQGRIIPSQAVLTTLCNALRLDSVQRAYIYELAGKSAPNRSAPTPRPVLPQLRRLLDALTEIPAFVFDRRFDIVAWNPLASAVYIDFALIPDSQRNYANLLFTHPKIRSLYADWDSAARTCVATLRMSVAEHPNDPRLLSLVDELSAQDSTFHSWWTAYEVVDWHGGTVVLNHPLAGQRSFDWDSFGADSVDGQSLMTMTAEQGSPTHQALQFLASWDASTRL